MELNSYLKAAFCIACLIAGFLGGCSYKQRQLDQLKADYAEQVSKALEENRALEKKMQADADAITVKYNKEKKDAEKTIADLRTRIANGTVRLSIPVSSTGMSAGSGSELGETRAELDGETAQSLVSIVSDGDDAIRDLNQCIDKYNAIRGVK